MPELGTVELGTTELGTPSTQTSATLSATGARASAAGGTASLTTQGTLTAAGATATASPGGATLNITDLTTSELGTGELGTGMLGVASNPDTVTMTAQGATAEARGPAADLLTSTTLTATGTTAEARTPGALVDAISGGILGTGELGGGMLGVSTGASGVIMAGQGATGTATGGGSAKLIDLDLPEVAAPSRGWHVEVDHPSGRTLEPQLLDDPQFTPRLKDYPRVEIPVPRNEKWQAEAFEEASLRVWEDGDIRPIDTLVDVQLEPGRAVLVGRGGSELQGRVQAEFDNEEAHVAAEQLAAAETTYTINADDPGEPFASNKLLQDADAASDLREALLEPLDRDPVEITDDGRIQLLQSAFFQETFDDVDRQVSTLYIDNTEETKNYSDGDAAGLRQAGDYIEFEFTNEYTIPADHFWVAERHEVRTVEAEPDVRITVDGDEVYFNEGDRGAVDMLWRGHRDADRSNHSNPSADIEPGTHTARIEATSTGNADFILDCIAPYDSRYGYTWDDDTNTDWGYLDGPEPKPDAHEVVFADATTAFNVTGGRIQAVLDDTSNQQALALSNDRGTSWTTASNTETLETDFASPGASLRWKVTLSRYGSQSGETPLQGVNGQSLDAFELRGDLEDTPVLTDVKYDGQLRGVLNEIADFANAVWEVRRHGLDDWSIEWTHPGLRTSESDASLVDYTVSKSIAETYEKAVIKGAAQPVRGGRFEAVAGEWRDLRHAHLVPATDIVRDPDSGMTFERGVDYDLDRSEGRIKARADGAMTDGTVYEADYRYKTQGEYTADGAGADPDTIVRTISGITSTRGCTQAALYLVRQVQEPLWEAEVMVPTADAGQSLVDDLALEDLPTKGERMEVREIEQSPREAVLRLGSRQSVGEVINDIQSRISSVSERV